MAASREAFKDLDKLLECAICLDRLVNPKDLICSHSFCKSCIEEIMVFRPDKSAVILCPLRCEEKTVIGANETVNILRTSIHFKNIIEYLNEVHNAKKVKHWCVNSPDCQKISSHYCEPCQRKMCNVCKNKHVHIDKNDDKDFIHFKSNDKDPDVILPWCNEHSTYATYMCEDGFICTYCKTRSHAKHTFHKIDDLYDEIHTWVMDQHPQLENLEELLEKCHRRSTDKANISKGILVKEIRIRKQILLEKYLEKLNLEEEELLKRFGGMLNEHFDAYPSTPPSDYISNKAKFEVLVERESIIEKVNNITSENVMLPHLSIKYPQESMNEINPLGTLHAIEDNVVLSEDTVTINSEMTESTFNVDRLHALLEELNLKNTDVIEMCEHKGNRGQASEAKIDDDVMKLYKENGIDVKTKLLYLMGLMERNDIDTFDIILNNQPSELIGLCHDDDKLIHIASLCENVAFAKRLIEAGEDVNCTDGYGDTPLHHAAMCGNTNMVKLLLEHNADMLVKSEMGNNAIDYAKWRGQSQTARYLEDVLKMKKKKDDGKFRNITMEQLKRDGLVDEEERNWWWNDMKQQLES